LVKFNWGFKLQNANVVFEFGAVPSRVDDDFGSLDCLLSSFVCISDFVSTNYGLNVVCQLAAVSSGEDYIFCQEGT